MPDMYKAVCQWCGKQGDRKPGSISGGTPIYDPKVQGTCPSHPSGKPNMPHAPKWEKA